MFKEHDIVYLVTDLPEHDLTAGTRGVILWEYTNSKGMYEVEFELPLQEYIVLTLPEEKLRR